MAGDEIPDHRSVDVTSDESWKDQVKEDDRKRDAEQAASAEGAKQQDQEEAKSRGSVDASQLPPPRFEVLVQLLSSQALTAMGLVPGPDGQATREPAIARHFIDMLGMLEEKTSGNLNDQESKLLKDSLHQLRMAFIEVMK